VAQLSGSATATTLATVREPGPLLAAGRDADIFEYGPGLVLRRSREGRSMALEAQTMEHVRSQGFPVPAVDELSDDGMDIVMERIEGANMVTMMSKRPWTIAHQGRVLADLHDRLHQLTAPAWLHDAPAGHGSRLLHFDLHPLNVMVSPRGPIVIDWTAACRGDPAVDVAMAWVLMKAGVVPTGRFIGAILGQARSTLVKSFLRPFDLDEVKRQLHDVVAWKVSDPHMSVEEQTQMWEVVTEAGGISPD
jgi:aminoglycoside phosphotransferase (APT) family kinase protein